MALSKSKYHHSYPLDKLEKSTIEFTLLKRLLTYLRPYRSSIVIAILFLFAAKGIEAFVPLYIGKLTQRILDAGLSSEIHHPGMMHSIISSGLYIIFFLGMSYLLEACNVIIKSRVGQKAIVTLREDVYRHIITLPQSFFDKRSVGRLMTRTIHDVDQINQMFTESVVPIVGSAMLFICIFIGIIILDWRLAIVVTFLLPFVIWHTNHFRKAQRISYNHVRMIVSAMNSFIQEHLMGIAVIRKFGLRETEMKYFDEVNEDQKVAYLETIYNFSFFNAGIDFAISAFFVLVFVMLIVFAPPEGFQAGTYFALSLYALMIFRPLSDLAERYNVLQSAFAAADRIFHVLDVDPEDLEDGVEDFDTIETIEFKDVWFAYNENDWVLKGLSFKIVKGESIAFVGATGAGKSTIISLLLRAYDYQKGEISINGKDIKNYSKSSLRKHFSIVLQDPVIFSGTIADNIKLFDKTISDKVVEDSIDYVNLREYIARFSGGVNHFLSERGKSLSVGEMQLISMARAVARESNVLILDEATASIDSHTEKVIQKSLRKMIHEKTALVIAHRLSTITDVTRILVIHQGRLAEAGTHQELLAEKGIYEKLYRLTTFS